MSLKQAFISVPMRGRTPEEIQNRIEEAGAFLEHKGYLGVSAFFISEIKAPVPEDVEHRRIYRLAQSLGVLSKCSLVYMCSGWEQAEGCSIEHAVAITYGLDVIYEDEYGMDG